MSDRLDHVRMNAAQASELPLFLRKGPKFGAD